MGIGDITLMNLWEYAVPYMLYGMAIPLTVFGVRFAIKEKIQELWLPFWIITLGVHVGLISWCVKNIVKAVSG